MVTVMAEQRLFTLSEASAELGTTFWRLAYLYRAKRLPEPRRFGGKRLLTDEDLERARQVMAGGAGGDRR